MKIGKQYVDNKYYPLLQEFVCYLQCHSWGGGGAEGANAPRHYWKNVFHADFAPRIPKNCISPPSPQPFDYNHQNLSCGPDLAFKKNLHKYFTTHNHSNLILLAKFGFYI
jgi:hypothetical protein